MENNKWSDLAALNIVYINVLGHKMDHLSTRLRAPCWGQSVVAHWLKICASTAGGMGLIPHWETKIPHTTQPEKRKERDAQSC